MTGPKCITCKHNNINREASYCYPIGHAQAGKRIYCKRCSELPNAEPTVLKYEYKRLKDRTQYQREIEAFYQYQATLATQQPTAELIPAHVTEQHTEEVQPIQETEEATGDETPLPPLTPEEKAYVLKWELRNDGWCFFNNFREQYGGKLYYHTMQEICGRTGIDQNRGRHPYRWESIFQGKPLARIPNRRDGKRLQRKVKNETVIQSMTDLAKDICSLLDLGTMYPRAISYLARIEGCETQVYHRDTTDENIYIVIVSLCEDYCNDVITKSHKVRHKNAQIATSDDEHSDSDTTVTVEVYEAPPDPMAVEDEEDSDTTKENVFEKLVTSIENEQTVQLNFGEIFVGHGWVVHRGGPSPTVDPKKPTTYKIPGAWVRSKSTAEGINRISIHMFLDPNNDETSAYESSNLDTVHLDVEYF